MIRWRFMGVALVVSVALIGCGPDVGESTVPPSWTVEVTPPSPTPSRTWTAQEQAAIDAVQAYLAKWIEIGHDPANADIDSIREVTTGGEAEVMLTGLSDWRERGLHLVGEPSFEPIRVDPGMIDGAGHRWDVTGCYIVTGVYLADADGVRISDDDRVDRSVMIETVLQTPEGQYFVSGSKKREDKSC